MSSRSLHKALSRRQNRHLDSSRSEPNSDFNVIKSVLVIKADFNVNLAKDWSNTWVMTNSLLPFRYQKRPRSNFRFLQNHSLGFDQNNRFFRNCSMMLPNRYRQSSFWVTFRLNSENFGKISTGQKLDAPNSAQLCFPKKLVLQLQDVYL